MKNVVSLKDPGDRTLHGRTVVAPDVEDQRVVQLAHLIDRVEEPADVPVGVLREAREDLHLAGVELLLGVAQAVPRGIRVGSRRELSLWWDDAQLLLALEGALTVLVPTVIELALVLVGPLFRDVVRGVRRAGGVVDEPWLLRIVGPHRMEPLDRLVRDVVGEVVELPVLTLRHAEDRVVLRDDRVVLAGCPGEEAPPVVEAPRLRPVLERSGGTHLAPRSHVPLAEAACDVPVLLQDPRQGRAAPRARARVARERAGELRDSAHAHAVVVAPCEEGGARRRAHGRHMESVVGEAHLLHPCERRRTDLAAERLGSAEPCVIHEHDQHVRRPVGRLWPGDHRPVANGLVHGMADRPAEGAVRDGEDAPVLGELAHRLGQ